MKFLLPLLLSALVLAGCSSGPSPSTTTSTTSTTTTSSSPPVSSTPAPPAADVVIALFKFAPDNLTKAVGAKVTWRNDDAPSHTVTADDGSFDSGTLATGATFSFTGTKDSTIGYHCKIHPSMTGKLIVGSGTPPPTPTTPSSTPTTPTQPAPTKAPVTINAFMFSPATLSVKANTNVTWTNNEIVAQHSVIADDGTAFKSGPLDTSATFSHLFLTPGTFAYHCGIHPTTMTATVVVT